MLCVDMAAEEVCPPSTGCFDRVVGATVIVEPPSCDVSPTITMGIWVVIFTSDIIGWMGLVGVPSVPLVSPDAIFDR